jgi:cytochrome c-type biogenesis protein CcmH
MRLLRSITLSLALIILNCASSAAKELDPALEKEAYYIYDNTLSPFCPGRLLRDCPSSEAVKLKETVREMLEKGQNRDQIFEHIYSIYGEEVRASPPQSGFGLVAWLIPGAFLILGLAFLMLWLKTKTRDNKDSSTPEASQPHVDQEILERAESEIRRADG